MPLLFVVSWSGVSVASEGVGVLLLMSGGWLLSWSLFGVSVGCQLVGVLLSSRCRFSVLMLSGGAAHALRLVAHLVGVSVASDGVPRCCPHIGSRAGCSCSPIGCRLVAHLVGVSVAHALQMSGGCRGHLVGIGCRCSSLPVGRVSGWCPAPADILQVADRREATNAAVWRRTSSRLRGINVCQGK